MIKITHTSPSLTDQNITKLNISIFKKRVFQSWIAKPSKVEKRREEFYRTVDKMEIESTQDTKERLSSIQRLLEETCAQFEKITKKRLESRRFEDPRSFEELKARISSGEKGEDDASRATRQRFLTIVSVVQTWTGPIKSATDVVSISLENKEEGKGKEKEIIKIIARGGGFISAHP